MKNKIYPCIWFDGNAREVASFYCSIFDNSSIRTDTPLVVEFDIEGIRFMGLNGGPSFRPNPAVSFYMTFRSEEQINRVWKSLSEEGKIMMPLEAYDWSTRYGWVEDMYGVSWQLTLGEPGSSAQPVIPALMFVGEQFGKGEEALKHYSRIFKSTEKPFIHRYPESDTLQGGKIAHAQFTLTGQKFILMDSGLFHDHSFTEGISLVIECETQEEIDHYWNELSRGGTEGQCGWLKDRFGFSWQVIPDILPKLMSDPDKAKDVMQAFMKMKKFEINKLLQTSD